MAGILDQRFHKVHVITAAKNRAATVQRKMDSIHTATFTLGGVFDIAEAMRVDQLAMKVSVNALLAAVFMDTFSYQTIHSRITM